MATHGKIAAGISGGIMKKRAIVFAGVFASAALAHPARADFVLHHWQDEYEPVSAAALEGDLLYYWSDQNYNSAGAAVAPTGTSGSTLSQYNRMAVDLTGQFGLFDGFSIFGRLSWARFENELSTGSSTTYGFADQTIGADFRVVDFASGSSGGSPVALDLQAQADLPAYGNSGNQSSNSPYQGDGSVDLSFGGFLTIPVKQTPSGVFAVLGGLGYTFRSNNYSAAVPWSVTGSYAPKPATTGLLASISGFGVTSMNTDTRTLGAVENGFVTGSGGSFITNAINPSLITLRGQVGYQLASGNELLASVDQSVWGENSPVGTDVVFGFRMNLGSSTANSGFVQPNQGLAQYTLDAKVTRVNDRLNLVEIDKGANDGVAPGQIFDIFSVNPDGSINEAAARCRVTDVKSDEAALTIIEYFKQEWINQGFAAKRLAE